MRNIFIAFIVMSLAGITANAQLMAGHRGSLYGLENSRESFTNGIKLGYDYLETDVRVTKDGEFVCSHDETTERLGGKLVVADATLAELQAEPLRQTRGGIDYEGNLCSLKEYLDICREGNVKPLIELKWSTGINNNDFSNIPALIETIDSKGFIDSCIILTSMKNCLEYIHENYPHVNLQFLTGQYWANHFDWCVEKGIAPDIQRTFFDEETVKRFHDNGLKVNAWVINEPEMFEEYRGWGCDFITTDKLPPEVYNASQNKTIDN